jgi:hypothetical protein
MPWAWAQYKMLTTYGLIVFERCGRYSTEEADFIQTATTFDLNPDPDPGMHAACRCISSKSFRAEFNESNCASLQIHP